MLADPLTSDPGYEIWPSFSPDESQVAFTWDGGDPGGPTDIYSMVIGAAVPRPLTQTEVVELAPAWSPDGKWIAFVQARAKDFLRRQWPIREPNADLMLMPASGGPGTPLAEMMVTDDFFTGLSWTPDSSQVLFTRIKDGRAAGIAAIDINSHEVQPVTDASGGSTGYDARPSLSADGRVLVFLRGGRYSATLYALDLDERVRPRGVPHRLTSGLLTSAFPVVLPTGDAILYSSRGEVRRLPLGSPDAAAALPWAMSHVSAFAVSRSGTSLAFVDQLYDLNMWQARLSEDWELVGDLEPLHHSTYSETFPTYSPDGRSVAFQSNRSGAIEVWVGDGEKNLRQLTHFSAHSGSPAVSPDGATIAFDSNESGAWRIYTMPATGGSPTRLELGFTNAVKPEWSPDAEWMYFFGQKLPQSSGIWKARLDGSGAQQLLEEFDLVAPHVSLDGAWVYFWRDGFIWRIPAEGGEPERIVDADAGVMVAEPGLFFARRNREKGEIRILLKRIPEGDVRDTGIAFAERDVDRWIVMSVSPDGRQVAIVLQSLSESDIMLARNFGG